MNEQKFITKNKTLKIERKKFLSYIGIGTLSFSIFSVNPIKIFFSKSEKAKADILEHQATEQEIKVDELRERKKMNDKKRGKL